MDVDVSSYMGHPAGRHVDFERLWPSIRDEILTQRTLQTIYEQLNRNDSKAQQDFSLIQQ
jgi:hypothetical protein